MYHVNSLMLFLLTVALINLARSNPSLKVSNKVATLRETSSSSQLSAMACTDSEGEASTVSITSVLPDSPCGQCFQLVPCSNGTCLQYVAGINMLDYTTTPSYIITLECSISNQTATEVLEILVIPNGPPYFIQGRLKDTVTVDSNQSAGSIVYKVKAIDPDSDVIAYSFIVLPESSASNYIIDSFSGNIINVVSMRSECQSNVEFHVFIKDGKYTRGPLIVDLNINKPNTAPLSTNLNTAIQIPETTTDIVYNITFLDMDMDVLTYTVTSLNSAGFDQFVIDGKTPNIRVKSSLDYENPWLRDTDLIIQVNDGFCSSQVYTLKISITDVNEPPSLTPIHSTFNVCESQRSFDPGYIMTDPDTSDVHVWSLSLIMPNVHGWYQIDQQTGFLQTLLDYDVDQNNMRSAKDFIIEVKDKGKLTAKATVAVNFLDCNDSPPVFDSHVYDYVTTECTTPGNILKPKLTAKDRDSSREHNNEIYFKGGNNAFNVSENGDVILLEAVPAGSLSTFNVFAKDRGLTPGPLTSRNPAVVSVIFKPCPTVSPSSNNRMASQATLSTTTAHVSTTNIFNDTIYGHLNSHRMDEQERQLWSILVTVFVLSIVGVGITIFWVYGKKCRLLCDQLAGSEQFF